MIFRPGFHTYFWVHYQREFFHKIKTLETITLVLYIQCPSLLSNSHSVRGQYRRMIAAVAGRGNTEKEDWLVLILLGSIETIPYPIPTPSSLRSLALEVSPPPRHPATSLECKRSKGRRCRWTKTKGV